MILRFEVSEWKWESSRKKINNWKFDIPILYNTQFVYLLQLFWAILILSYDFSGIGVDSFARVLLSCGMQLLGISIFENLESFKTSCQFANCFTLLLLCCSSFLCRLYNFIIVVVACPAAFDHAPNYLNKVQHVESLIFCSSNTLPLCLVKFFASWIAQRKFERVAYGDI